MVPRATLIAVLAGVEVALVAGMISAVRGDSSPRLGSWSAPSMGAGGTMAVDAAPFAFPVGSHPALVIDVGSADVTIDAGVGSRIDVSVSDESVHGGSWAPISARVDGSTVRVSAAERDFWSFLGDSRTVHVIVPPATAVTVERADKVVATGLRADASITSTHAGITVRDFRGTLTATTSNGNVEVADADCPMLHVKASNGHVTLTRVTALHIDASSSNGRVEATALNARDGSVSTSNGHVSLDFAVAADTTVTAAASNGHVSVSGLAAVPANRIARPDPSDDDNDDSDDGPAKMIRIGAGGGRLDVHASNGSIDLMRES